MSSLAAQFAVFHTRLRRQYDDFVVEVGAARAGREYPVSGGKILAFHVIGEAARRPDLISSVRLFHGAAGKDQNCSDVCWRCHVIYCEAGWGRTGTVLASGVRCWSPPGVTV